VALLRRVLRFLTRQAERGLRSKFLAGDGTFSEEQLIDGAGRNAEGVYVAAPYVFNESNEMNRNFLDAYWNAYAQEAVEKNQQVGLHTLTMRREYSNRHFGRAIAIGRR